jgi:NADP-dependent 3-hydroxy acid dehydrogenase YdfG
MENIGPKTWFEGKRVLITGASSGIGHATATWLLQNRAKLAVCGRNYDALSEFERQFPGQVLAIRCDFAVDREQYNMVLEAIRYLGGCDILINAAGCIFENDLEKTFPQDHDYLIDVNCRAVYHISQLCMVFLAKAKGCIVNVSSEWGSKPT